MWEASVSESLECKISIDLVSHMLFTHIGYTFWGPDVLCCWKQQSKMCSKHVKPLSLCGRRYRFVSCLQNVHIHSLLLQGQWRNASFCFQTFYFPKHAMTGLFCFVRVLLLLFSYYWFVSIFLFVFGEFCCLFVCLFVCLFFQIHLPSLTRSVMERLFLCTNLLFPQTCNVCFVLLFVLFVFWPEL